MLSHTNRTRNFFLVSHSQHLFHSANCLSAAMFLHDNVDCRVSRYSSESFIDESRSL